MGAGGPACGPSRKPSDVAVPKGTAAVGRGAILRRGQRQGLAVAPPPCEAETPLARSLIRESPLTSAKLAAALASQITGQVPVAVTRFATGSSHYVYEAAFTDGATIVLRIGGRTAHAEIAGAVTLSQLLRPRGVPLPRLLDHDSGADFPWMALERLPGTDLGDVVNGFSDAQLDAIARRVADAQAIVAADGPASRFGYAVRAQDAPHETWTQVLQAHLDRSTRRIASAGLFDRALADGIREALDSRRGETDAVAATPFLHDTTTKNVIVTPTGDFSGIVDVDDLCFGDPRYAPALTMAALIAHGGPTRYVDLWLAHAGQAADEVFGLYVGLFLLDLMSEHGQVFNGNERASSAKERARLTAALAERVKGLPGTGQDARKGTR